MFATHFIVTGRVQGVYFRQSARAEADKLGITGWIRNNADKTVEGIACGTEEQINQFIAWCRNGPVLASVKNVMTTDIEAETFLSFEVMRD